MAKLFGGKDPFEDPFFNEPFERLFDWKNEFDGQPSSRKQITIDEINPDGDDTHHAQEATDQSKQLVKKNPKKKSTNQGMQSLSYRRVAYGGLNGWYYSCSEGRMTGRDGVVLAEIKEEDKTIGESLHTISKGIRDKGMGEAIGKAFQVWIGLYLGWPFLRLEYYGFWEMFNLMISPRVLLREQEELSLLTRRK
ncbi:hypothetical protein Leryth_022703 [Lithospermum erythrorhizon]|nr:hypothetical protein Leryth_022703 [Lithospermum erythrorhizon]